MTDREVRRGDIFWCPVMEVNAGGELYVGDPRPVIIVSNDRFNTSSNNITVVPITTKEKKDLPSHVKISVNKIKGTAMCEKVSIATKDNLGYFCGTLPQEQMGEIDKALCFQLSLEEATIHIGDKAESRPDFDLKIALVEQERDLYKMFYEQLLERLSGGVSHEVERRYSRAYLEGHVPRGLGGLLKKSKPVVRPRR